MTPWNWHPRRFRRLFPFALLCALTVALVGFGGSPQAPVPPPEPQSVGPVANLVASAESQGVGTVRLTWTAAENAQSPFHRISEVVGLGCRRFERRADGAFQWNGGGPQRSGTWDFLRLHRHWNAVELDKVRHDLGQLVGVGIGYAAIGFRCYGPGGADRVLQRHRRPELG